MRLFSIITSKKTYLIFLIFWSALLIFYKFNIIPPQLDFDEVEFGRLALSLKDSGYIPYSTLATGHSTLYFYIILLSFKIFGLSSFALRVPSAIFGILGGVVMFVILEKIFKDKLLLRVVRLKIDIPLYFLLAMLFISLRWYFNFARFAFEATFLLFLELSSIYFILIFTKSNRIWQLIASGIFAALAFHSYTPGRIFFLVPLVWLFLSKVDTKKTVYISLYLTVFALISSPLAVYLFQNSDKRVNLQLYWANAEFNFIDKAGFFITNIKKNMVMFFWPGRGDPNGRHNYPFKPALNLFMFILVLTGFIGSIRRIINRNKYDLFFIFYFVVGLFPTLLTYPHENPNMLRMFTILPAIIYFAGRGVVAITNYFGKRTAVYSAVIVIMMFIIFYDIRTYFVYQSTVFKESFRHKYEKVPYTIQDILKSK